MTTAIALTSAALGAGLVLLAMAWQRDPWTVFLMLGIGAVYAVVTAVEQRQRAGHPPADKEAGERD